MNGSREWTSRDRRGFWLKVIGISIPLASTMATCSLATGYWAYTRASVEQVEKVKTDLSEKKEDKTTAERERTRIEQKIDKQAPVLGNVRDNLLILMERQRLEPKPLPPSLSKIEVP